MVTGNGAFGQSLATHSDVDKVGFTGSTQVTITTLALFSGLQRLIASSIYIFINRGGNACSIANNQKLEVWKAWERG